MARIFSLFAIWVDRMILRHTRHLLLFLTLLASPAFLSACASTDTLLDEPPVEMPEETQEPAFQEDPVEDLYNDAMDKLSAEDFKAAAAAFDEVERQHPYSKWATNAQMMAGYANYQASQYEDALIALERFIQLHPGNNNVSYAYYLKALCFYEQISDVGRDQKMTEEALKALTEVIKRFPSTEYARDASLKIDLTKDHLAGKEMEIGRYYLLEGKFLAALNRFKRVTEDHQTTTHVPEALYRMVEAYTALGLLDEAQKSAAVLGHNYPGSEWYQMAFWIIRGGQVMPDKTDEKWWKMF